MPREAGGIGAPAMVYVPDNPLIAQSDHTILLETGSPRFEEARDALLAFAELVKSPEYVHTWRITSLSLWNAAAAGHTADEIIEALRRYAKYPVPENLPASIRERMARYGRLRLVRDGEWLDVAGGLEPAPMRLGANVLYVREDVWEQFLQRADPELRERLEHSKNPLQVRPPSLLRNR